MVCVKKIKHHFVIKVSRLLLRLLYGNNNRDASFYYAITSVYDEIVLKLFINTIAKPHVKRLCDVQKLHICPSKSIN